MSPCGGQRQDIADVRIDITCSDAKNVRYVSESDAKNDGSQPYWVFRKWGRTGVKLGDKTWRSTAPTRTGVKLSVSKPLEQITLNNSV